MPEYVEPQQASHDFEKLVIALRNAGFSEEKRNLIFKILAGILHLGNVSFYRTYNEENSQECYVVNASQLSIAAEMLGVEISRLQNILVSRSLNVKDTEKIRFI